MKKTFGNAIDSPIEAKSAVGATHVYNWQECINIHF